MAVSPMSLEITGCSDTDGWLDQAWVFEGGLASGRQEKPTEWTREMLLLVALL